MTTRAFLILVTGFSPAGLTALWAAHKTERSEENATTEPRNINDLQRPKPESFDSSEHSKIEASHPPASYLPTRKLRTLNPQLLAPGPEGPQPDDDFLGSVVINPLECAAGVVLTCMEHEAAHGACGG